jgi:hypothetical protein
VGWFKEVLNEKGEIVAEIAVPDWEKWYKVENFRPFYFTFYEVIGEKYCWLVLRYTFPYANEMLEIRLDCNFDSDIIKSLSKAEHICIFSTMESFHIKDIKSGKVKLQYMKIAGTGVHERIVKFYEDTSRLRTEGKIWLSPNPQCN